MNVRLCVLVFLLCHTTSAILESADELQKLLQLADDIGNSRSCLCACNSSSKVNLTTDEKKSVLNTASQLTAVLKLVNQKRAEPETELKKSRRRRDFFNRRLVLPPGTTLVLTPTLALPLMRYPPKGFESNLTISFPVTIDFDDLGLTDNANPFGLVPDFSYVFGYFFGADKFKLRQDEEVSHRLSIYRTMEGILNNFGLNGKQCVLRAICELHEYPLLNYGLFGEILELLLSVTRSSDSSVLLAEYAEAEKSGKNFEGCSKYHKKCSKSLFTVPNDVDYTLDEDNEES